MFTGYVVPSPCGGVSACKGSIYTHISAWASALLVLAGFMCVIECYYKKTCLFTGTADAKAPQITVCMINNAHIAILCLTHSCNLNCVYCFEKKDSTHELTFEVACQCVDEIIGTNCLKDGNTVNLNLFGGEPLLKFELIKKIYDYVQANYPECNVSFFASTNGTLLSEEMKQWFFERKDKFCLGLSLDGDRDSQNHNRSNSFDAIDIEYFARNWPNQFFKLTISEYSVRNYAHDVKFIHSLGIGVNGGDVCVGNYKWDKEQLYYVYAKQLLELVDYYENNHDVKNSLFEIDLASCTSPRVDRKCCGCGTSISYYVTDGNKYPCTFIAPMAFPLKDLQEMLVVDFNDVQNFTDKECKANCYLYNVCRTCAAENYMLHGRFDMYNKRNCGLKKILAIAVAELQARRIAKNPSLYDATKVYHTIEAIKKIKELYVPEYGKYFMEEVENPTTE